MEDLTGLLGTTTPKPGCPGWRVDDEGREWYSDAWLDHHREEPTDLDALPPRLTTEPGQGCEFTNCINPAEVYGGYNGDGGWAGYACLEHAAVNTPYGFHVWAKA